MKKIACLLLALLMVGGMSEAYSKGGGGGRSGGFSSGRSSFSRSSSSSSSKVSTPTKSAPASTTKPTASTPSTQKGSSFKPASENKGVVTQKYKSATDQAAYEKAVKSGTAFKTRDEAVANFKTTHGAKYTSTFPKEPVSRPSYIPQTTTVGGQTYNVNYNQERGGYGYMNGLGTFIMFDALSDAVVMSSLMNNHGYYHGSPYVAQTQPAPVKVVGQGMSTGWIVFWICVAAIVITVVFAYLLRD